MAALSISIDDIPDLSGKTAIVTGGSSGIGLAAAEILLAHNAQVFVFDVQPPPENLEPKGGRTFIYVHTDLSSWSSLVEAFRTVTQEHNASVDIAISSAGVSEDGSYLRNCLRPAPKNSAEWSALAADGPPRHRTIEVNLQGTLDFVSLAARVMKDQPDGGSIVIITSATGYLPEQGIPVYSATKGALINLIRALRTTLPRLNVAISGVAPSATKSAMLMQALAMLNPDDPALKTEMPVSEPEHVGLAAVYAATARQDRRVEEYGRDTEAADIGGGRWNGRIIHTMGDTFTEVEGPLIETRSQWWGEKNTELSMMQQRVTDSRR